ncbi:MAG: TIGR03936 family radical SAM-associated protein [Peptostreptococcaceae bacterium]
MSKIIRVKFKKEGDMIYISHLDLQKLLQRAFRRADIELSYSQGYNPHPKMSYGNALALGTESYGEYVDIEIEEEIGVEEFLTRMNEELPQGIDFVKAEEIDPKTPSLASTIEYGEYLFNIELESPLSKELIKSRIADFMNKEEIMITKKNKKGKMVESNIRPMIKFFDILSLEEDNLVLIATIATGSKANLNTNIFIPRLLEMLDIEMDPLDVDILRRDLYVVQDGELVSPM